MVKSTKPKIMVTKDGPYLVSVGLPIDKQIIGIGKEKNQIDGSRAKTCQLAKLVLCVAVENQKAIHFAMEPTEKYNSTVPKLRAKKHTKSNRK